VKRRPRAPSIRVCLSLAAGLFIVALGGRARADVASWVSVAGGPTAATSGGDLQWVPSLRWNAGLGSPPQGPVVVGGGFDLTTHVGFGTDLGAVLRLATGAYARGAWGVALDLGGYHRFARSSDGASGALTLGAPWGLFVATHGTYGTNDSMTLGLVVGLDFARLTAHRTSGQQWWPNPLAERAKHSRGGPAPRPGAAPQWASAMSFR
jgi:hypothetical protein